MDTEYDIQEKYQYDESKKDRRGNEFLNCIDAVIINISFNP